MEQARNEQARAELNPESIREEGATAELAVRTTAETAVEVGENEAPIIATACAMVDKGPAPEASNPIITSKTEQGEEANPARLHSLGEGRAEMKQSPARSEVMSPANSKEDVNITSAISGGTDDKGSWEKVNESVGMLVEQAEIFHRNIVRVQKEVVGPLPGSNLQRQGRSSFPENVARRGGIVIQSDLPEFDPFLSRTGDNLKELYVNPRDVVVPGQFLQAVAKPQNSIVLHEDNARAAEFVNSLGGCVGSLDRAGRSHCESLLAQASHADSGKWRKLDNRGNILYFNRDTRSQKMDLDLLEPLPSSLKWTNQESDRKVTEKFFQNLVMKHSGAVVVSNQIDDIGEVEYYPTVLRTVFCNYDEDSKRLDFRWNDVNNGWGKMWTITVPLTPSGVPVEIWDGRGLYGHLCYVPYGSFLLLPAHVVKADGFKSNADGHPRLLVRCATKYPIKKSIDPDYDVGKFYRHSMYLDRPDDSVEHLCHFARQVENRIRLYPTAPPDNVVQSEKYQALKQKYRDKSKEQSGTK